MTRLDLSVAVAERQLIRDLADDAVVEEVLGETTQRRRLDLSDLDPTAQAALIASRLIDVLPTPRALRDAIAGAGSQGLVVKLGIEPTSAEVHVGLAVPLLVLGRLQRMGHRVVLSVGDVTPQIGEPSIRSGERTPPGEEEMAANLTRYCEGLAVFFDFERAELRHNSEWLDDVGLPELLGILAHIPLSSALQRDDFRSRLAEGKDLALSELLSSVVMALDSSRIDAGLELGGVDQLPDMLMGRRVMELMGQDPQLVATVPLMEGAEGNGTQMSRHPGHTVAVTAGADDLFGQVMAVPDRLTIPYLRAWTEWTDEEIALVAGRLTAATLHPADLKRILAGEMVAAVHGLPAAMAARQAFAAGASLSPVAALDDLPAVDVADSASLSVGAVLAELLHFTSSLSAGRRLARQNGLRIIVERDGTQTPVTLGQDAISRNLGQVLDEVMAEVPAPTTGASPRFYLKAGRQLAALDGI